MTDIRLARIEDDVQAIRGDVARLMAAVERIASAPTLTPDDEPDDEPPRYPQPGDWLRVVKRTTRRGLAMTDDELAMFEPDADEPGEDAPVEPPRDMAASIARGLAQAAAGQVVELDPDEYRPCTECRGGEAWPE